jgi:hypothetical protein
MPHANDKSNDSEDDESKISNIYSLRCQHSSLNSWPGFFASEGISLDSDAEDGDLDSISTASGSRRWRFIKKELEQETEELLGLAQKLKEDSRREPRKSRKKIKKRLENIQKKSVEKHLLLKELRNSRRQRQRNQQEHSFRIVDSTHVSSSVVRGDENLRDSTNKAQGGIAELLLREMSDLAEKLNDKHGQGHGVSTK